MNFHRLSNPVIVVAANEDQFAFLADGAEALNRLPTVFAVVLNWRAAAALLNPPSTTTAHHGLSMKFHSWSGLIMLA